MKPQGLWTSVGISDAELEEKADWICRDHRGFPAFTVVYFRTAGSLIRFSRYDFTLVSPVFFQAVIGLEKMLKHFYRDETAAFKELFVRAVEEGVIADGSFSKIEPLRKKFRDLIDKGRTTCAEKLACLIPALRNELFHGDYRLHPEFLPLALQVREAVDVLLNAQSPNS
ncbi:MAG: hypothetical protein K8R23_13225 [Chthoniobacter sp.]|nr:hypothetical protein [Chthoniobacter sp.]